MKKSTSILSALIAAFFLLALSAHAEEGRFVQKYDIGYTGEGGGIVFFVSEEGFDVYDGKGGSKKCHYLEVSKEELGVLPLCTCGGESYCKPTTSWGLGCGKSNTYKIVNAGHSGGTLTAKNSAARACFDYKTPTSSRGEWFLPSMEELCYLHSNLSNEIIGGKTEDFWYWSSSRELVYGRYDRATSYWWCINFLSRDFSTSISHGIQSVRAVRAF